MCIKVEWKIFKNIGFLTIKKATVKLKNRFYSCFFAIKLASGEWQVTSGKWQVASGKWKVTSGK